MLHFEIIPVQKRTVTQLCNFFPHLRQATVLPARPSYEGHTLHAFDRGVTCCKLELELELRNLSEEESRGKDSREQLSVGTIMSRAN